MRLMLCVCLLLAGAMVPATAFVPASLIGMSPRTCLGVQAVRTGAGPPKMMTLKPELAGDAAPPAGKTASQTDSKQQITDIVKNRFGPSAFIDVKSNVQAKAGGQGSFVSVVVRGTEEPVSRKERKVLGGDLLEALSGTDLEVKSNSITFRTGDVSFDILFQDAAVEGGAADPEETDKKSRRSALQGQPAAQDAVATITRTYEAQYPRDKMSAKGAESMVQTALSRLRGAGCEQPDTLQIFRQVMEDANKGRLPPSMVSKERGNMMKLGECTVDRDDDEVAEMMAE